MEQAINDPQTDTNLLTSISGTVRGIDSSHQLSMGVVLGSMIGLMPKDNLMAVGIFILLILSANLLTGAMAGIALTMLSPVTAPIANSFGEFLLGMNGLQVALGWLFQMPFAAWTRLDNTLVTGSLAIALIVSVPVYLACLYFFNRYRAFLYRTWNKARVINWFIGYSPQEA